MELINQRISVQFISIVGHYEFPIRRGGSVLTITISEKLIDADLDLEQDVQRWRKEGSEDLLTNQIVKCFQRQSLIIPPPQDILTE